MGVLDKLLDVVKLNDDYDDEDFLDDDILDEDDEDFLDDEDDEDEGLKRPGGPRSRAFFRGASLEGKRHTQRPPAVGVRRGAFLRRGEPEPCRMRYASTGFTEPTKGWGPEKLGTEGIWQTWVFHKPPSQ